MHTKSSFSATPDATAALASPNDDVQRPLPTLRQDSDPGSSSVLRHSMDGGRPAPGLPSLCAAKRPPSSTSPPHHRLQPSTSRRLGRFTMTPRVNASSYCVSRSTHLWKYCCRRPKPNSCSTPPRSTQPCSRSGVSYAHPAPAASRSDPTSRPSPCVRAMSRARKSRKSSVSSAGSSSSSPLRRAASFVGVCGATKAQASDDRSAAAVAIRAARIVAL
mmetsp:Transcript_4839/g.16463  ORF Transcript_4839/g.16463 Transcript_4839/m.16463 type:complete len:218 (-) Transcript_4839:99-752(-)